MADKYSASVIEGTTSRFKRNLQPTGPDANVIKDPEVDLLVEGSTV